MTIDKHNLIDKHNRDAEHHALDMVARFDEFTRSPDGLALARLLEGATPQQTRAMSAFLEIYGMILKGDI